MIKKLQKKLTALFMGVSFLLFFAIFALLIIRDVQLVRVADRAMFQNQFTSITYQTASGNIANKDGWEKSSAVLRLKNESGNILWQTNGNFADVPTALWNAFEQQLGQISVGRQGDLANINQSNIIEVKAPDKKRFIGSSADIKTFAGKLLTLEMLLPQTGIAYVLRQNISVYIILLATVLLALGLLSYFLVRLALKPAKQSIQSQKNFIAAASHELKSPLTVIQLNNAEAKSLAGTNSKINSLLDISLTESKRMGQLVNDMLALASSDAGHWKLSMSEISIETLLLEAYEKHSPIAKEKGIKIEIDLPDNPLPNLKCDKERMAQVLDTLIDNAARFSAHGGKITLQAKSTDKAVSVSVIDHGTGILDKDKPFIFERFFQGDASRTQQNNFGLGLSIAKEIVELHNGKIEVKDTHGGGATFIIWLSAHKK